MSGSKTVVVVAAMLEREGRFLVGRRSVTKATAPGVWCAVMGRVEGGETQERAVAREVWEEVGLRVRPIERVHAADNVAGTARIHWWRVACIDDAPARLANGEHSELRWVTVDEMRRLEPAFPDDVDVFDRVRARFPR